MTTEQQAEQIAAGLTEAQRELARHALGADGREPGYRNYFCASPGTPDDAEWALMVDRGVAVLRGRPREGLPYNTYAVAEPIIRALIGDHHG